MSNFANYVYDRVIDYIDNRGGDNPLRRAYASYMSAQNFNNQEMNQLVDVVMAVADAEMRGARSSREEEGIVRDVIVSIVDSHCGAFGMSDREFVETAPDDVYTDMKRHEERWLNVIARLQGRNAGSGRGERRSVFDRQGDRTMGSSSVSVFDRRDSAPQARASNSVFANRPQANQSTRDSLFEREERSGGAGWSQGASGRRTAQVDQRVEPRMERQPMAEPEPVVQEGPNYDTARPYDNFWVKGENWQLAHKSSFQWSWSPNQQTRRTYDPEEEVRFLVKGKDGSIREEFLTMADDLVEYAHEIRISARPNLVRNTSARDEGDSLFLSDDLDAVDLDALKKVEEHVRAYALEHLDLGSVKTVSGTEAVSTLEDAVLQVAGEAAKVEEHITAASKFLATALASDAETLKGLDAIRALADGEADLLLLQKRMKTLQGVVTENVMNFLDRHFTDEVNRALEDQFGLQGLRITSFIEDFEDLLDCGRFKKFGASYRAQFLTRTRPLLLSLSFLTEEKDRLEYMECTDILPVAEEDVDRYSQFRANVAVIFKPSAVLHVKANSSEFGMVSHEVRVPGKTGQAAQPELAHSLQVFYALARRASGAGHVYLVTADNICFELVPISGARDIIGIRLV